MTQDTPTQKPETEDSTPTMGSVDHTHPERDTTFGSIFGRGPTVAADGGEPAPSAAEDEPAMEDVDHDAPSETGANAAFERGAEHDAATDADVADGEPTDE